MLFLLRFLLGTLKATFPFKKSFLKDLNCTLGLEWTLNGPKKDLMWTKHAIEVDLKKDFKVLKMTLK